VPLLEPLLVPTTTQLLMTPLLRTAATAPIWEPPLFQTSRVVPLALLSATFLTRLNLSSAEMGMLALFDM
jgi:hypothetical protein